ncbi:MAG: HAD family hydrolase, partial [Chloroflexi bacterium]|nr:HAD family hydrolase [Chloroflexota bacterium]
MIASVGTEVYDRDGRPWPGWDERFETWDGDRARHVLAAIEWLQLQPVAAQTPLKASYFAPDARPADLAVVRNALTEAGLAGTIVYSSSLNLDVVPDGSGKGEAARAVARTLRLGARDVLVFGDSGNDLQLFQRGFLGTIVANAERELRAVVGPEAYRSPYPYADGVLDGIRHWSREQDPSAERDPAPPRREPARAG